MKPLTFFWKITSPLNAGEKIFLNGFSGFFKIFKKSNRIFDNEKKIGLDEYVGILERKLVSVVCKIEKWTSEHAQFAHRFLIERTASQKILI